MTVIVNNFQFPIIADDNRNADTSWANHRARGSAGGVDLAYPSGSPIYANAAGTIKNLGWFGSGGLTLNLILADGRTIQYMHLSSYLRPDGATVAIGDTIGISGASGNGSLTYYAAHLHVHMLLADGTRVNLFNNFSNDPAPQPQPVDLTKEDDMFKIVTITGANAGIYLVGVKGNQVHIQSPYHVTLLQRFKAEAKNDQLLQAEMDIVKNYMAAANSNL